MKVFTGIFAGVIVFSSLALGDSPLSIESIKTFELESPWPYQWEKEKPNVETASLIVVHADPSVIRRQEGFESVIFVEDRIAERVRVLDEKRMAMIVPGLVSKTSLIWLGPKALPEDIDKEQRLRLYQVAKADYQAQKSLMSKLQDRLGISNKMPPPKAKTVNGAVDIYKASDSLN